MEILAGLPASPTLTEVMHRDEDVGLGLNRDEQCTYNRTGALPARMLAGAKS